MKALSICQPYAMLIVLGLKHYETRKWTTGHRGKLVVHAGKTYSSRELEVAYHPLIATALKNAGFYSFKDLPRGALIGEVVLTRVHLAEEVVDILSDIDRLAGNYTPRHSAFRLEKPRRYKNPVPCPGNINLWNVPSFSAKALQP